MLWRIIAGILLNALAAVFLKPKGPRAQTLDDFSIPRADEGAKVFDFAGTAWRKDPHVAWYGDFVARRRGEGLFVYYLGFHLVLCRQIDFLLQIKLAEKDAWFGQLASGRSSINKGRLFGGTFSEGGFIGDFDLLNGDPDQPINDYLETQLGELTSAYRGVGSLVFRRPYVSANTARLPTTQFKMFNVAGIHRDWFPEKALIGVQFGAGGASIYIAMDVSNSMSGTRIETEKAALAGFVRSMKGTINSVRVVQFSGTFVAAIERFDCFDSDYEDIALWIEAIDDLTPGTDFAVAVASAPAFFEADTDLERDTVPESLVDGVRGVIIERRRKVVVFTTDGLAETGTEITAKATLDTIPDVEVFAFNIDQTDTSDTEVIDNTPADGVPVVTGDDPGELAEALSRSLVVWADVNPAHIIRCLWTDPMRGGIASDAEIGDSFEEAADLFLAEGFGLSVPFRGADLVESDRLEVERHVDAVSYRSRRTGKIELKPIRNDYVVNDLPVLDSSIVLEWSGLERTSRGELANQLTVVYTKRENGETASVTRTNIAGVRRAGRVIPADPVEYPFITTDKLATRACLRDLSVQDRPLLAGTLRLAYLPPELEIGEPFILNEPLIAINNVVVRILELQEGDGRDNSVTVQVVEDRYVLPAEATIGDPDTPPTPTPARPLPSPYRVVQEAPYYLMVQDSTKAAVDAILTAEPDVGVLLATGTKANDAHQEITVAVDVGAGYIDKGQTDFASSVVTLSALTSEADDVVVTVADSTELDGVTANSLALIGTELVRIDSLADNAGDIDITIGRGVLDTVPVAHAIGARIIFLQSVDPRDTQYVATDAVDVKLLTSLVSETLSVAAAPIDTVTFASRPIRPYPPGQFKINGSYVQNELVGASTLTWVGRDRTVQSTTVPEDHEDAAIGPEAGVTYLVQAEAFDIDGVSLGLFIDEDVGTDVTYVWDAVTPAVPTDTRSIDFSVASVRDGYESWQKPKITTIVFLPPGDLASEVI